MALNIPVTRINSINTPTVVEETALSESAITAEMSAANDNCFFIVDNSEGTADATVVMKNGTPYAKSLGRVAAGKIAVLFLDSMLIKENRKYTLNVNPANSAIKISAVEFLPVVNN